MAHQPSNLSSNQTQPPSSVKRTSGLAIASFVCGLIGFLIPFPFMILGLLGLIFGIVALVKINRDKSLTGVGFGITGLVLGSLSFLLFPIFAAIAIPNFMSMRQRAREASTKSNMHTLQLALEDYSTMAEGMYPSDLTDPVRNLLGFGTNQSCVADACPATVANVSVSTEALLPRNKTFANPFLVTGICIDYNPNGLDPPPHNVVSSNCSGQGTVYYTPVDKNGFAIMPKAGVPAYSYVIYGDGTRAVLEIKLTGLEF